MSSFFIITPLMASLLGGRCNGQPVHSFEQGLNSSREIPFVQFLALDRAAVDGAYARFLAQASACCREILGRPSQQKDD